MLACLSCGNAICEAVMFEKELRSFVSDRMVLMVFWSWIAFPGIVDKFLLFECISSMGQNSTMGEYFLDCQLSRPVSGAEKRARAGRVQGPSVSHGPAHLTGVQ